MIVAVISDTHKIDKYIKLSKKYIQKADILVHLGDNASDVEEIAKDFGGKIYSVRGNCDVRKDAPIEQIIEVEGKKIFFTHGHEYGVKYTLTNIMCKGMEVGADVVLFGHTHEKALQRNNGMIFMNPGSISLPRMKGRYIGFLDIDKQGKIETYFEEIK